MNEQSLCRKTRIIFVFLLAMAVGMGLLVRSTGHVARAAEEQKATPESKPPDRSKDKQAEDPAKKALPKLVDLGAGKCIPCKKMAPILDELKKEYEGKFEVVFIDVWKNPDEAKKYNINLIPTQIFFDAVGKELFRHEGFFPKEDILAKWKELGVDVTPPGKTEKK